MLLATAFVLSVCLAVAAVVIERQTEA